MDHLLLCSKYPGNSAAELTHVVSEPIFNIARLVEATLHQCVDSPAAGRARKGGKKCVPLGLNLNVGRQAGYVDKVLGVSDRLFVERSNPHGQRVDESIELRIRQSTIDVAIKLGEIASNIVCAEQHFQRPSAAYQPGESGHRSAAWNQAGTNFKLRQNRLFATRKAHIACERKLASDAGRAPAD